MRAGLGLAGLGLAWLCICFIVFSLNNLENALFLLCVRSKMLKTNCFTMFSLNNVEKPMVVLCLCSEIHIKSI